LDVGSNGAKPLEFPKSDWVAELCWNLTEEHKTSAPAGTQTGGRVTKHSQLESELHSYVSKNPGCSVGELADNVSLPWGKGAPAKARLLDDIRKGRIKGLQVNKSNRTWWVYPEGMDIYTGRMVS
jgi:hypothetical protein